jgi:hypothetical protein
LRIKRVPIAFKIDAFSLSFVMKRALA